MAFVHIPALLRTVRRGDSCCWRYTPPLLKALPRQLNSEPLHHILDPGERSPEQRRRPALSSASAGTWVTISLINMNPGKQTDWRSISLAVCILLNNVWPPHPPPGTKKVTRGFTSTFSCPAHTHSLTLQEEVNPGKQLFEGQKEFSIKAKWNTQKTRPNANKKPAAVRCTSEWPVVSGFKRATHTL